MVDARGRYVALALAGLCLLIEFGAAAWLHSRALSHRMAAERDTVRIHRAMNNLDRLEVRWQELARLQRTLELAKELNLPLAYRPDAVILVPMSTETQEALP